MRGGIMRGLAGYLRAVVCPGVALLVMSGCGDEENSRLVDVPTTDRADQSCVVCHTDQQALMKLAVEPLADHTDSGET